MTRGRKEQKPTFDDMAVALSLAAARLKLDLDQTETLAYRVGIPEISISLAVAELRRHLDLVVQAHEFFKANADIEALMRATAARKKRLPWLRIVARKVAAL